MEEKENRGGGGGANRTHMISKLNVHNLKDGWKLHDNRVHKEQLNKMNKIVLSIALKPARYN